MPILLDRSLLGTMLDKEAVHRGAIEAFSEALLEKGWTMAPRDKTFHTADEWKIVRTKGGVWLEEDHLPKSHASVRVRKPR